MPKDTEPGLRVSIDAEGLVFQIMLPYYKAGSCFAYARIHISAQNTFAKESDKPMLNSVYTRMHCYCGHHVDCFALWFTPPLLRPLLQGRWRRTKAGFLVRDEVYDGRECCLMHFVGSHIGIDTFMSNWESAGAAHLDKGHARRNASDANAWIAMDAHGSIPVWGKCEAPTIQQDPKWDW